MCYFSRNLHLIFRIQLILLFCGAKLLASFNLHSYAKLKNVLFLPFQWVLSTKYFNFPFPITLTMIHMGFSGLVAFFLVRVFKVCFFLLDNFLLVSICVFFSHHLFCFYFLVIVDSRLNLFVFN